MSQEKTVRIVDMSKGQASISIEIAELSAPSSAIPDPRTDRYVMFKQADMTEDFALLGQGEAGDIIEAVFDDETAKILYIGNVFKKVRRRS